MAGNERHILDRLQEALDLAGNTHTQADVGWMVQHGKAQMWADDDAIVVTEVHQYPNKWVLHFWLAAGDREACIRQADKAMEWARKLGCTKATIAGRKGWLRVLKGWQASKLTLLEREL